MSAESVAAFRARAREWLDAHAPRTDLSTDLPAARAWQSELARAGFAALTWPTRYGGAGLSTEHDRAFNEEAQAYPLPTDPFAVGFGMCGPTLLDVGTDQQREYLPDLVSGAEIWCQLFSEPAAGSDVAGLRTRAVPDGSDSPGWVIIGQKVWTSRAQYAERGMLLARTDLDVPKHRGLTMFVIDMRTPGVTVRPLRDMTGEARFNEVFLDEVRVPAEAVVGAVGGGWQVATVMLRHERVAIGTQVRPRFPVLGYPALLEVARRSGAIADPGLRADLALQRTIIGERVLGLSKEPQVDRDVPFRSLTSGGPAR